MDLHLHRVHFLVLICSNIVSNKSCRLFLSHIAFLSLRRTCHIRSMYVMQKYSPLVRCFVRRYILHLLAKVSRPGHSPIPTTILHPHGLHADIGLPCQPSRNGRDRPGIDPRCPVSRARLILSRKCENSPLSMDIWLFTNECFAFCIVFVIHTRLDLSVMLLTNEIVIIRVAANNN